MAISGEYYFVQIGSVYLTIDGTSGGAACLTKVDGLARLFLAHEGASRVPLSGKPFNFVRALSGNNVRLISKPFSVTEGRLADLKSIINTANSGHSAIRVVVSNGPGATTVDCDPLFDEDGTPPLNFAGNFFNSDLYDVEIRLITRGLV